MKTTPKDFFLHLFAVVALYSSAIALINLAFSVVNYYNPDALSGYFSAGSVAWPISMLIVMVPVLYVIEWFIGRDITKMPEKKEVWIRRWRIYLTLFLAGLAIVIDLITLINTYLNGEITGRFVYKVLIVIVVAGAIFAYYLLSRTIDSMKANKWRKTLAWVGIVIVLMAIIGGFAIVGSPAKQRAIRLDNQRINDLTTIQYQVINYWQRKGILPAALTDLNNPISNFTVPTDPETKAAYEYSTKSGTSFELCGVFSLADDSMQNNSSIVSYPAPIGGIGDSWAHTAGHVCFERIIDPSLYPPMKGV